MMKTFLAMMMLCLPCAAQRKLWTWDSPLSGVPTYNGAIHAAAADAKGNTALVIGETAYSAGWPVADFTRYRLLWISFAGSVLHDELVDRPGQSLQKVMNVENDEPWSVISVSAAAMVVTDSRSIWTVKLKGKQKSRSVAAVPVDEIVFPAGGLPASRAWFRQKLGNAGAFIYADGKTGFIRTPAAISLWMP